MSRPAKMRVVIVEPGQYAREAEIDNTLEAEQAVVGGLIDVICRGRTIKPALSSTMKASSSRWNPTAICQSTRTLCLAPSLSAAMAEKTFAA